jgi:hypothetical protein
MLTTAMEKFVICSATRDPYLRMSQIVPFEGEKPGTSFRCGKLLFLDHAATVGMPTGLNVVDTSRTLLFPLTRCRETDDNAIRS